MPINCNYLNLSAVDVVKNNRLKHNKNKKKHCTKEEEEEEERIRKYKERKQVTNELDTYQHTEQWLLKSHFYTVQSRRRYIAVFFWQLLYRINKCRLKTTILLIYHAYFLQNKFFC